MRHHTDNSGTAHNSISLKSRSECETMHGVEVCSVWEGCCMCPVSSTKFTCYTSCTCMQMCMQMFHKWSLLFLQQSICCHTLRICMHTLYVQCTLRCTMGTPHALYDMYFEVHCDQHSCRCSCNQYLRASGIKRTRSELSLTDSKPTTVSQRWMRRVVKEGVYRPTDRQAQHFHSAIMWGIELHGQRT